MDFGTFSASIYDTAWLDMVDKEEPDGLLDMVFSECFDFLLCSQDPTDEGRSSGSGSTVDDNLNTMTALLLLEETVIQYMATTVSKANYKSSHTYAQVTYSEISRHKQPADNL